MASTTVATAPVESKVKYGAVGAAGGAVISQVVLWVLGCLLFGSIWDASSVDSAIAAVPGPLAQLVNVLIPAAVAYWAGFKARHTFRPDLEDEVEVTVDGAAPVETDTTRPSDFGLSAIEILVGVTLVVVVLLLFGVGANAN